MARSGLELSFFIHAVVYAIVVGGLILLNLQSSSTVSWAGIVAWGWGTGLAAHAVVWLWFGRRR